MFQFRWDRKNSDCTEAAWSDIISCYLNSSKVTMAERQEDVGFCYLPQLSRWTSGLPPCPTREQVCFIAFTSQVLNM